MTLYGFNKTRGVGFIQRPQLLVFYSGKCAGIGGIEAEITYSDGLLEGFVENAMNVLDRKSVV